MADFRSFKEVGYYLREAEKELWVQAKQAKRSLALYLQQEIRAKHGVRQPWRPAGSNPTPLLKTGALRKAVSFSLKWPDIKVYSRKDWLARIHEYGATRKMTQKQRNYLFWVVFKGSPPKKWRKGDGYIRIPARPIRRTILKDPKIRLWAEKRVAKYLSKVFK